MCVFLFGVDWYDRAASGVDIHHIAHGMFWIYDDLLHRRTGLGSELYSIVLCWSFGACGYPRKPKHVHDGEELTNPGTPLIIQNHSFKDPNPY